MFKDIKHLFGLIRQSIKRSLEETLQAWMNWTVCGKVEDKNEEIIGGAGTSQYTTYVIGPCITRVYTGQKKDI